MQCCAAPADPSFQSSVSPAPGARGHPHEELPGSSRACCMKNIFKGAKNDLFGTQADRVMPFARLPPRAFPWLWDKAQPGFGQGPPFSGPSPLQPQGRVVTLPQFSLRLLLKSLCPWNMSKLSLPWTLSHSLWTVSCHLLYPTESY